MLGRYVVGLAFCTVATNLVAIGLAVMQGVPLLAWQALRGRWRPTHMAGVTTGGGWIQIVTNALFGAVFAAYTVTFVARAPVESVLPYHTLGLLALVILQATNVRSKIDLVTQRADSSAASYAALPWAVIGAPLGWAAYLGIAVRLEYGDVAAVYIVGGALTKAALVVGDWLVARVIAVGLLAMLSINLLVLLPVLPSVVRRKAVR